MDLENSILKKSLQDLDGKEWGEPKDPSHLVMMCLQLRQIPLEKWNVENLRLMIGQKMSLAYLIPLALEHLQKDPWMSGDFYKGDLLKNVLSVPSAFWHSHFELKQKVDQIVQDALVQFAAAEPEDFELYDIPTLQILIRWQTILQK